MKQAPSPPTSLAELILLLFNTVIVRINYYNVFVNRKCLYKKHKKEEPHYENQEA